jgi:hypothetical protein
MGKDERTDWKIGRDERTNRKTGIGREERTNRKTGIGREERTLSIVLFTKKYFNFLCCSYIQTGKWARTKGLTGK